MYAMRKCYVCYASGMYTMHKCYVRYAQVLCECYARMLCVSVIRACISVCYAQVFMFCLNYNTDKQLAHDKAFFATYQGNQVPFYLYPSNYHPQANLFALAPTLTSIHDAVNTDKDLDDPQQVNHCVVNYYQHGLDYIGKHNNKVCVCCVVFMFLYIVMFVELITLAG